MLCGNRTERLALILAFATGCAAGSVVPAPADAHPGDEPVIARAATQPADYEQLLTKIEAERAKLGARFRAARTDEKRELIRALARDQVVGAILDQIFPAWMGTPWGLGRHSTATRPHQSGMTVGCSYFVTSVLENAGLELDNRYRFAQAPALHIQRSLAPARADLHRILSIAQPKLRDRVARLGDGLYLIGLNNHVGFVVVRSGDVRFVHASYTSSQVVTDEPLVTAEAIANSRKAGYFVTPLFQDDRLVELWLLGKPVPFRKLGAR